MRRSTVGFLDVRHVKRLPPDDPIQRELYEALVRLGFQHTIWQIVYPGQQMALILSQDEGKRELHVRFFETHVEAELEVARRYVAHFICGRCCAKAIVLDLLGDLMSRDRAATVFRPRALRKSQQPPTDSRITFEMLTALVPGGAILTWALGHGGAVLPVSLTLAYVVFILTLPTRQK